MSLLAVIDTETTGLDFKSDYILELGCALYDPALGSIIEYHSDLICWPWEVNISQTITDLTGITKEMVTKYGKHPSIVFENFNKYIENTDYLCGHNIKKFDWPFLDNNMKQMGIIFEKPLLDTMVDLPESEITKNKKLKYMALEHGHVMMQAHRVIDDIRAVCHLLSVYDFKEIETRAKSPEIEIVADVKYQDRELAKAVGFHWNQEKRCWFKIVKEFEFDKLVKELKFPIKHNWNNPKQLSLF